MMPDKKYEAAVIGASAGALEALGILLAGLPKDFSLPLIIVVHLPPDKDSMLAELLSQHTHLIVKEAEDKEPILPGYVYIAAPDYHLLVEQDHRLSLSSEEPVRFSRPSIDVLFETAADAYSERLIGIILTGANADGALGLASIMANGGTGLVLKPELAYVATMPEAALKACPDALAMGFQEMVQCLSGLELFKR